MALVRVAQYSSTPTVVGDYQAQNAHLQAFTNQLMTQQFILDSGTDQPVIKQGCYVSHGGSLYVADADTPITGSPSDGSVYIRVSGTTTLTVEFVNNISGYAWNPVHTALTNGSYTLLPYLIVKASTVWARYNFNPNNQQFGSLASLVVNGNTTVGGALGVTGAISGASINTGYGAFEIGQNLRTTDSPTFASINTGQGANELYPMNQAVRTTDSPTFAGYYANNTYGNHRVFPTIVLNYTFGGSHATTQMPAMEVGMSAVVKYTPYSGDADNALILPAGGVYVVAGSASGSYGTAYTGALVGGSVVWLNSTAGSHSKYFYVVRIA